jgi:hypothetical protein
MYNNGSEHGDEYGDKDDANYGDKDDANYGDGYDWYRHYMTSHRCDPMTNKSEKMDDTWDGKSWSTADDITYFHIENPRDPHVMVQINDSIFFSVSEIKVNLHMIFENPNLLIDKNRLLYMVVDKSIEKYVESWMKWAIYGRYLEKHKSESLQIALSVAPMSILSFASRYGVKLMIRNIESVTQLCAYYSSF